MRKLTKLTAILLGQEITDEESVAQGRELSRGTTDENLTHGWCQMCDGGLVVPHPLSEELVGDGICWRNDDLGTKEQRGEDISLDRIVGNTRQHGKPIVF